nr:hypothetical protein [Clostridia bacterium]
CNTIETDPQCRYKYIRYGITLPRKSGRKEKIQLPLPIIGLYVCLSYHYPYVFTSENKWRR